ncbi:MAG: hypothetical protein JWM64_2459 [Frankiales bacterium]|nr:hypothetical protein [Frankiales bacterium]
MTLTPHLSCPTCQEDLQVLLDERAFRCSEDHHYTVVGLALTTNIAALRSLWMAIRALEQDAASLHYLAQLYGDDASMSVDQRRAEADAAYEAAHLLRGHARRAQDRLDALPAAPGTLGETSASGAGGAAGRGIGPADV